MSFRPSPHFSSQKDCVDILLPSITKLVNLSLIEGVFPQQFKKAVVTPLIKKASLPNDDLENYRLVSGLCFMLKLVERVVVKQLMQHINSNNLDNPHQSVNHQLPLWLLSFFTGVIQAISALISLFVVEDMAQDTTAQIEGS